MALHKRDLIKVFRKVQIYIRKLPKMYTISIAFEISQRQSDK